MEITLKHFGRSGYNPSSIIELTISHQNTTLTVGVTNRKGKVDEQLIDNLREVVNELEEQNELINKQEDEPEPLLNNIMGDVKEGLDGLTIRSNK